MVKSVNNLGEWNRSTMVKKAGGFDSASKVDQLKNRIKAQREESFSINTPVSVRNALQQKKESNQGFLGKIFGGQELAFSRPGARRPGIGRA